MPKSLPVLLSAALALAPLPALAERGNGNGNGRPFTEEGFCPPGLADRNPDCLPPGQARRAERKEEVRPAPPPEAIIPEIVEELLREREGDDQRTDEAALIVGALLGLAAMERASREAPDIGDATDGAPSLPPAPAPESVAFSEVPSRPPEIEALADPGISDAALPEPEVDFAAEPAPERTAEAAVEPAAAPTAPAAAPIGPPVPIGEPSFELPPPQDLSRVFERAERAGDTGF